MEEQEYKDRSELVERFKLMINEGITTYFDSEEIEIIIDELLQQFDLVLANEAIELAIHSFPFDDYFRILKVKKLILEFDIDEAEKELLEIESRFPPSSEFYLEKVLLARLSGKSINAIDLLKKALTLNPDNPEVHFSLAYEYIKDKKIADALFYTEFAMNEDIYFEEQLFTLSYIFEETQQFDEAITFFTSLTELFPLSKGAWFGLALAYSWKREYQAAIDAYQFVLSIDESAGTAHYNIGNAYYELEEYTLAKEEFLKAYNLDSEDYLSLVGIADCLVAEERYDEAMEYYNKTLDNLPNQAIIGILSILKTLNKIDEAQLFIDKAFSLNPLSFDLLFSILPFYKNEEHIDKLKRLVELTLEHIENIDDFFFNLTQYCLNNGLYDLGITLLDDYIENEELTFTLPFYIAALHYLNQHIDEGNRHLKIALLINYKGHTILSELDPTLLTLPDVIKLIDIYKPLRKD